MDRRKTQEGQPASISESGGAVARPVEGWYASEQAHAVTCRLKIARHLQNPDARYRSQGMYPTSKEHMQQYGLEKTALPLALIIATPEPAKTEMPSRCLVKLVEELEPFSQQLCNEKRKALDAIVKRMVRDLENSIEEGAVYSPAARPGKTTGELRIETRDTTGFNKAVAWTSVKILAEAIAVMLTAQDVFGKVPPWQLLRCTCDFNKYFGRMTVAFTER